MGLDMYLEGRKHPRYGHDRKEDGFTVNQITVELGYWRKHPNLHGFIVKNFADGNDNCEPIYLDADDINTIIKAVKKKVLPHTEGFFFGISDGSDEESAFDIKTFKTALKWLQTTDDQCTRGVYYTASW